MTTNTTPRHLKPHVSRTHLNGWKCEGLGVAGYGMTVECAYRSWERRFDAQMVLAHPAVFFVPDDPREVLERELLRPLTEHCMGLLRRHFDPDTVQPDLGIPFCHDPL